MTPAEIELRFASLIEQVERGRTKNLIPFGNAMQPITWIVGYLARNKSAGFEVADNNWTFGFVTEDGKPEQDGSVPATCVLAVGWTEGKEKVNPKFRDELDLSTVRSYITIGVGQTPQGGRGIVSIWPEAFGSNVPMNAWEDWAKVEAPDRFRVTLEEAREWFGTDLRNVVEANLPAYFDRCARPNEPFGNMREAWKKAELKALDYERRMNAVDAAIVKWGEQGHGFKGVTSRAGLIVMDMPTGPIQACSRKEGLYGPG